MPVAGDVIGNDSGSYRNEHLCLGAYQQSCSYPSEKRKQLALEYVLELGMIFYRNIAFAQVFNSSGKPDY
jgi:hypothetical protein